ncbi:hypothetical protein O181_012524 [Austropuccinia psidii MF-1]|uniref:Reverse transcriptase n=1 Tax=Austropuccinia psidii MF-1 TaxID=1389203 RepID=A0A9Q3GMY4_9BASI|nr:hypothetical protein [Austropuccinia psidii MF-1]
MSELPEKIPLIILDSSESPFLFVTHHTKYMVELPSFPSFEWYFLVIDTPKAEDLILGFDFLSHFNSSIYWRQGLITFNSERKGYCDPSKYFRNDFSSAKSWAALVGDSRTPSLPSSVHIPTVNSHPSLLSSRDEVFKVIQDVGEDNSVSSLHLFFGNMDLPPSSYHDSLEELWDEEEEPEEVETIMKVVPSVYHQYLNELSNLKAEKLSPKRAYDHHIKLEGSLSPVGVIYSLSKEEPDTLRAYISENLEKGFIRPSPSSTGAPVLFVKKKDGDLRLCVDYCKLNSVTRKNNYPIPPVNKLLNVFNGSSIFSKIDLRGAYNLLRIKEGDEHLTAFRTKYGSYEYLVIPFGLTNAPASFQNLVNDIFQDLLDVYVVAYLDDIMVFSKSEGKDVTHVSTVLSRLRANSLFAKASKCLFHVSSVEYLVYVVSSEGLKMDQAKVQKILNWPPPRTLKALQSFLGFENQFTHHWTPWPREDSQSCQAGFPLVRHDSIHQGLCLILSTFLKKKEYSSQEVCIAQTSSNSKWSLGSQKWRFLFQKYLQSRHWIWPIYSSRISFQSIKLKISRGLSTAYHPETDGQTERVNQILAQYLWIYVSYHQDDWNTWLPLAESAYNNSDHSSTKQSPFFTVYGRDPQFNSVHITQDTTAGKLSTKIQSLQKDVNREHEVAINRFRRYSDKSRASPPVFNPGDMYSCLPPQWKSIHPVFHISLIEPVKKSIIPNRDQEPPPPIIIEEEEEWKVSQILDSKPKRRKLWYLVEWKGSSQDPERSTWETAKSLKNFPEIFKDFHSLYPDKPGPNSSRA